MPYEVLIQTPANRDLARILEWYRRERGGSNSANKIADDWLRVLDSLEHFPESHPIANESPIDGIEYRNAIFGVGRTKSHRAVFRIDGDVVRIVRLRHHSQCFLSADDL